MVISMEQYASLRRDFLSVAKFHMTTDALEQLKSFYQEAINSVRTLEYIDNIESLIKILEKRGCVRYDNITPLRHIAHLYFGNSTICVKLDEYDAWVKNNGPFYPPQTNLYQVKNGECYSRKKKKNNLSQSNLDHNNTHINSEEKFSCIVSNDDSSDSNNSAVSISSQNNRWRNIILTNNINRNNNLNDNDKENEDFKSHVVSCAVYNVFHSDKENVVSVIKVSTDLIPNDKVSVAKHPSIEDSCISDMAVLTTPLISTPRSVEPKTTVCSSEISVSLPQRDSLGISHSKDNLKTLGNRFGIFVRRKSVRISLIVFAFSVISLSTLFILYGSSNNSVRYKPEATAPILQDVYTGHPQTSSNPYTGYESGRNRNSFAVYNPVLQPLPPLQTLTEREARLQDTVFEKVSSELGIYWQDVARYLDIREYSINDIDKRYSSLEEKALAALKMFAGKTDLDHWQRTLKKALVQARRRDLMEAVEDIASRRF